MVVSAPREGPEAVRADFGVGIPAVVAGEVYVPPSRRGDMGEWRV
jgi:hypothetical protein